ncbi:hypothetical protein [Pseudomonas capsici]|uniref:hypothetical protein n=1 Tax=Pseudomonas capsici TaxID=2810614 RepID=UPI0021F104A5|nr:hypothetical protein [Pseudomonas capsici]MCV4339838.1 hypothetical protein [Pseudomonas capsici]
MAGLTTCTAIVTGDNFSIGLFPRIGEANLISRGRKVFYPIVKTLERTGISPGSQQAIYQCNLPLTAGCRLVNGQHILKIAINHRCLPQIAHSTRASHFR